MAISITPSGGSATTLCHGPGRTLGQAMGPSELTYDCAPGIRERRYVGDTGPRREATGMDDVAGSLSVVVRCASADAAKTALSTAVASTPRVGTLTDGVVTLYDCGITRITGVARGRSAHITYAFAGALHQGS